METVLGKDVVDGAVGVDVVAGLIHEETEEEAMLGACNIAGVVFRLVVAFFQRAVHPNR